MRAHADLLGVPPVLIRQGRSRAGVAQERQGQYPSLRETEYSVAQSGRASRSRPRSTSPATAARWRSGSMKRVAAAVGEGSSAVASVHRVLAG
ncbi:hypothetical protein F6J84_12955 [Microbacterium caowuchunii]|nr:hypothetical protein F6J84_12955 [Microbacterium caowuchunii]